MLHEAHDYSLPRLFAARSARRTAKAGHQPAECKQALFPHPSRGTGFAGPQAGGPPRGAGSYTK